ncbi:unnamed protein product [Amaranthus hypochondriacus]
MAHRNGKNRAAQVRTLEARLHHLDDNNAKLLGIIEGQNKNSEVESEGKFYKRLATHYPRSCDGEADPVKFEDWICGGGQ